MSSDPINPSHYKHLPAEAIDIIMAAIAKAPSNESAYLQGQVLKYLLRCWSKKGIEDLRKAKWYLDRMVNEFDDLLAEASGANETPDGGAQIPQGWRELKSDEVPSVGDKFLVGDAQYTLSSNWTVTYGCGLSDYVYIRKIELQIDEPTTEPPDGWRWVEVGENFRVADTLNTIDRIPGNWIGTACVVKHCAFRKIEPTKRYRDPTQADLANGPIECEYREHDHTTWKAGVLTYIAHGDFPFVVRDAGYRGQWNHCRIEVT
jgi:hypothetical protein